MKKTTASIHVEVMCECPHCGEYINIMPYLSGECIDIFKYADLEWETDAKCPECKKCFEVKLEN